jgi:phasin family protein
METKPRRSPRVVPPVVVAPAVPTEVADIPPTPPLSAPAETAPPPAPVAGAGGDALAALMESQAAVARGMTALGAEIAALTCANIDAATRSATDLLSARTLADAIAVNTGFARESFEALLGGSARLSEIGAKLAAEAARPIVAQLNRDWTRP